MEAYSNYIALSRYARWKEDEERRETWKETVDRYVDWLQGHFPKIDLDFLRKPIKEKEVMPSMRALMTAGPAADRDNMAIYNCSYLPMEGAGKTFHVWHPEFKDEYGIDEPIEIKVRYPICFDEAMYVLLCGTGVGFSVERKYVETLPRVGEKIPRGIYARTESNFPGVNPDELSTFSRRTNTVYVADSKYGWASALRILIVELYNGNFDIKWDLSKIRPAGAILKTFGGRASGPEPLNSLFKFCVDLFKKANGRKLTSVEAHDIMCKIAEVVVVGGVRRSALISLSNLTDERMRYAKSGAWWEDNPQRALANNSVCYTERPDMGSFMREWVSLYESKSGERGIFNRDAAKKTVEKIGRRDPEWEWGTNPCQPGFATVLAPSGIVTFDNIDVGSIIWSGKQWTKVVGKIHTGKKKVYEYSTSFGRFIGTPDHRIIQNGERCEVGEAESIDICIGEIPNNVPYNLQAVLDGLIIGDGTYHKASNKIILNIGENDQDYFSSDIAKYILDRRKGIGEYAYEVLTTIRELPPTYDMSVPDKYYYGNYSAVLGFLRGLYSANGSVCGGRVTLKQTSYKLIKQVQEMLSSVGIRSYITTNKSKRVKFSNGEYICKESYDLNITVDKKKFKKLIGFIQQYKMDKILGNGVPRKDSAEITSVTYLGEFDVYDIQVEAEEHTYWTGGCLVSNCSEIILRPRQVCNLTEVVVRPEDTFVDLEYKVRIATILGTLQSSFTNLVYLSEDWEKNIEEERLLGVSLTGIMDHPALNHELGLLDVLYAKEFYGDEDVTLEMVLEELKQQAIIFNRDWAEKIGINPSKAITCVKPSGTVSQLVNSASGIHPRYAPYYKRSVRSDNKDPITQFLIEQGVPYEKDLMNPDSTTVFYFPIKSPEASVFRNDRTAIQQLELWKIYAEHWCEHKPSITVYVKEDEWMKVGAWVYKNFDICSGVSFLPYSEHTYKQAPYEEISKEEYEELFKGFPDIDWSKLQEYEKEDSTTGSQEYACTGGACEIL